MGTKPSRVRWTNPLIRPAPTPAEQETSAASLRQRNTVFGRTAQRTCSFAGPERKPKEPK